MDVTTPQSLQTPNWRHQLACQAVANGQLLLPSRADGWTRQLARYLRRERRCRTVGQRRRLADQYVDLATALELFRAPDRQAACQLEVLILAREPRAAAAEALRVSAATVEFYHSCLFCVEPHLNNRGFILEHAIQPELKRGPTADSARLRFLSKLLAYFCGLEALEQLVPGGQLSHSKPWCHPVRLFRQLVNGAELAQLAELAATGGLSFARDPKRFTTWLEQLLKRVQTCLATPLPDSPSQRRDRRYMTEMGMGGFNR